MTNFILYASTVFVWGSTWIAITFQLGDVPVQQSIGYRFFLAAVLLFVFCRLTGRHYRFQLKDHIAIALQGFFLFSTNYYLFYLCTQYLTSGLVSVLFSTLIIWNILGSALFFQADIHKRVIFGAALGLSGITAIFWHELSAFDLSQGTSIGLILGLVATLSASAGNLTSMKMQGRGWPVMETITLAMLYGSIIMFGLNIILGDPIVIDLSVPYLSSLLYLAVFGSVIGFGCYLTLMGRIGADRAAYSSVLFPVVALTLSTLFEGFSWTFLSLVGVSLVLLGNVFILLKPRT
jgi:drug/metabolite transporter (DMT)-like permease